MVMGQGQCIHEADFENSQKCERCELEEVNKGPISRQITLHISIILYFF